jgi:hypothetical protein
MFAMMHSVWPNRVRNCAGPNPSRRRCRTPTHESYFRRDFQGSTPVARRARKHGTRTGGARGLGEDTVPVAVARARVGDTLAVLFRGTSTSAALVTALQPIQRLTAAEAPALSIESAYRGPEREGDESRRMPLSFDKRHVSLYSPRDPR